MTDKLHLSWADCKQAALLISVKLQEQFGNAPGRVRLFGVPRGGVYAAMLVSQAWEQVELVESLWDADAVVDDLIDSGETRIKIKTAHDVPFFSLYDKQTENTEGVWIVFPWERTQTPWQGNDEKQGPTDAIRRILQYIGENPDREGLKETPERVIKSYAELFGGYKQSPKDHLKIFKDGTCDEMVILKDIEFHSVCEHHMQPFFGKAHIAYIPDKHVVGVSKLARILDTFARRLQIQERLTDQVADALMEHLQPLGAACVIESQHFCMVCRGVRKQNSTMVTSSMRGAFRDPASDARRELLSLLNR